MESPFEQKDKPVKSMRQFMLNSESIAVLNRIRETNKATNSEIIEMLLTTQGKKFIRGE